MPLLFANFRRWSCLIHKWFCPKQVGGIQAFHWFSVTTSLYVRFGVDSLAEPLVSSSFLSSSLLDSLLGTLFPLGLGHLDLPCSVPSAGWRWAGKFTSHIWESTWVPSRHCEPVLTLLFFGFAYWFLSVAYCEDFEVCLFCSSEPNVLGLAFPGLTSNTGLPSLLFKHGLFIQSNNFAAISMLPILLPAPFICICVSRSLNPRLHLPHTLSLSAGLVFFSL